MGFISDVNSDRLASEVSLDPGREAFGDLCLSRAFSGDLLHLLTDLQALLAHLKKTKQNKTKPYLNFTEVLIDKNCIHLKYGFI